MRNRREKKCEKEKNGGVKKRERGRGNKIDAVKERQKKEEIEKTRSRSDRVRKWNMRSDSLR